MIKIVLILAALLALSACAPDRPCLKGHHDYYTTTYCASYGPGYYTWYGRYRYYHSGGCRLWLPRTDSYWVCDVYGSPYPSENKQ